ncbi:unnamed protein product [Dovyalis caffra]|uniref:PIN-like protein n=1 Tax=Dovyalis caffra TaxID=77055 RepID=A0AAV1SPE9_9ROSI|nr:unnamed protein product [Dovyalis caffra]
MRYPTKRKNCRCGNIESETFLGCYGALESVYCCANASFECTPDYCRRILNSIVVQLVFFVLSPALVGSNLAKFITLRSLFQLWFMPINVLITFIIGSLLGWLLVKITKAPKGLRGVIMGCCAAGNLGNMLLIIVQAVCKEKSSPFGDSDVCTGRGMAYVSLSMAIGSLYIWSYVYNIVRIYSSKDSDEAKPDALPEGAESAGETNESSKCRAGPLLPLEDPSLGESHMQPLELDFSVSEEKAKVPFPENIKRSFLKVIKKPSLRRLLAPSIIGAVCLQQILILGSYYTYRIKSLKDKDDLIILGLWHPSLHEKSALQHCHETGISKQQAAVPIMTLIVGANLLKGLKGSKMPLLVLLGIVAIRNIILPTLGVVIIKYAVHFGLVHSDPLYQFVLLLQFALPPAISVGTMSQLFEVGQTECSVIMLWTNALATVSLTVWSAFFIWFVR